MLINLLLLIYRYDQKILKNKIAMKKYYLSFLLSVIACAVMAQVQKPSSDMSWKKRLKMADQFYAKKDFASAAAFYQSIIEDKPKKLEIAYKAGDSFYKIRDFANAASALKKVKDQYEQYPKVGWMYANALKQSSKYEEAGLEFEVFINNYKGDDADLLSKKVVNELKGCELAIEYGNNPPPEDVEIEFLSRVVNSDQREFAPIPFVENLLYFSSFRDGSSQIYRSERTSAGWENPVKPPIFGSMEKQHFGHGTFTSDRKAFYFTQCDVGESDKMKCEIYVMQRTNNKWLKPVRLPEYINEDGKTATQPYVTVIDGKEILYFVSDRDGGQGGLDIWYVTKDHNSGDFNFSLPVNVGKEINTIGDEVTPFYDKNSQLLYFSSTGHPGIGGYDIFKSAGEKSSWGAVKHLGIPTNSIADDHYYILSANSRSGYFISNRLTGTTKEYTDNDDIFFFKKKEIEVVVKGKIFEKDNESKLLDNVLVELFEINESGRKSLLVTRIFDDGAYQFQVMPNKKYSIEVSRDEYLPQFFEINTNDFTSTSAFTQDLALEKKAVAINERPQTQPETPEVTETSETTETTETNETTEVAETPETTSDSTEENNTVVANNTNSEPPPPGAKEGEEISEEATPEVIPGVVENATETETESSDGDEVLPGPPGRNKPTENTTVDNSTTETENTTTTDNSTTETENMPTDNSTTTTNAPERPVIDIVTEPIEYEKEIDFVQLDQEQIKEILYVDQIPYIRINGELVRITGIPMNSELIDAPTFTSETTSNEVVDFGQTASEVEVGTNYKIQLVAVKNYKKEKFKRVERLGKVQLESATSRDGEALTRVLLTPFTSLKEAKRALAKVNARGFKRAYIVRYEDGTRMGGKIRLESFYDEE